MAIDITVPEVGESITEGVIVEWHVKDGETVEQDGELFELETDKITMTVQAEQAGVVHIKVGEDETVEVGQVVGTIDPEGEAEESGGDGEDEAEDRDESTGNDDDSGKQDDEGESDGDEDEKKPKQDKAADDKDEDGEVDDDEDKGGADGDKVMPAARRLIEEHGLDASRIEGSGKKGRILKEDVVAFMQAKETTSQSKEAPALGDKKTPDEKVEGKKKTTRERPKPEPKTTPKKAGDSGERQTRKPMSQIRKRIAQRLLEAKNATAMLTTFNEVDMSALMAMRGRYKDDFADEYGIKLGVMSFFVKAAVDALKRFPEVNRFIDGDEFVENHYYDIGIAVSTDRGLMVPVIRDADKKSFAEIEQTIADYAKRAREGKISLDELTGGTFTITNGGIFGSMLSTPILNPPQSAILGMHGIKKRPMVNEETGEIEVKPMMYLAVSYDHRVIDGRESVSFLKRIMECIEHPERMMFEI